MNSFQEYLLTVLLWMKACSTSTRDEGKIVIEIYRKFSGMVPIATAMYVHVWVCFNICIKGEKGVYLNMQILDLELGREWNSSFLEEPSAEFNDLGDLICFL